ncbi:MAG: hypothetical protein AAB214_08930, partial [Fibrobacterota bacterium]
VKNLTQVSKTPIPLPAVDVSVNSKNSPTGRPTISSRADGLRFEGFDGVAKVKVLDAQGRQLATFSVTSGQFLSRKLLPAGFCLVKLGAAGQSASVAVLP